MAVAHDTATESHTASTGSASEASFSWSHTGAGSGVKGVLVFTFVNANANNATSVTYGGASLTAVQDGRAVDTATEAGDCKTWFLGSAVPQGTQTVVVNRTNNANVMYAVAITVTAAIDTETFDPVLLNENQALTEQLINDMSPVASVRYAGVNSGLATHPAAGASSTELHFFPATAGTRSITVVRETTAGTGARNVGFSAATDDVAAVYLSVREKIYNRADITCDMAVVGNPPDADGTALTQAILRGVLIGPDINLVVSIDPSGVGQTVNADIPERPHGTINVRTCGVIGRDSPCRSYRVDNGTSFRSIQWSLDPLGLNIQALTVFGTYKSSVPDQGASGDLFDVVRLDDINGHFVVMQLNSGVGGPGNDDYALNIETDPAGVTTHSTYISVVPGRAYWICLHSNKNTNVPKLAVWDISPEGMGKLIGSVTSTQHTTAGEIATMRQGNGENGSAAGAFTYLQLYADWTLAAFPVPPPYGAMPPFNDFARPRFIRPRRKVM